MIVKMTVFPNSKAVLRIAHARFVEFGLSHCLEDLLRLSVL